MAPMETMFLTHTRARARGLGEGRSWVCSLGCELNDLPLHATAVGGAHATQAQCAEDPIALAAQCVAEPLAELAFLRVGARLQVRRQAVAERAERSGVRDRVQEPVRQVLVQVDRGQVACGQLA